MRQSAPVSLPVALTIAGSDSGGGAGIQADLQAMAAAGAFPTSAITAVTAQHTRGVEDTHVLPPDQVGAQIDAVLDDFDVATIKTGMLATADIIETVADRIREHDLPLVVDPVMIAASGDRLLAEDAEDAYDALFEQATLVTPNADEAATLTNIEITDAETARVAGERLRNRGADAALIKGGHVTGDPITDVLVTDDGVETMTHERIDATTTHGSGCALAASIAGRLACGVALPTAVAEGIGYLDRAIRHHYAVGRGGGAVNHLVELRDQAARERTRDMVATVVQDLEQRGLLTAIPDGDVLIAGCTPAAAVVDDVASLIHSQSPTDRAQAAVGRIHFDTASDADQFLLEAREWYPSVRLVAAVPRPAGIESRTDTHAESVVHGSDDVGQAARGRAVAREALSESVEPPLTVTEAGLTDRVWCLAESPSELIDRLQSLFSDNQ